MEIYDLLSNEWSQWLELPDNREWYGAAIMERKLYIIGGYNNGNYLNTCSCLDLDTLKWCDISPLKSSRWKVGVAVLKGHLYAVGGWNNAALNSVERFE